MLLPAGIEVGTLGQVALPVSVALGQLGLAVAIRLAPGARVPGPLAELVVDGFIVGKMRPGTLFGYDRHPSQGPWVLRTIVRFLHRHTGYLTWDDVARVDWEGRRLHLRRNDLRDLAPLR